MGKSILLADDNEEIIKFLKPYLIYDKVIPEEEVQENYLRLLIDYYRWIYFFVFVTISPHFNLL